MLPESDEIVDLIEQVELRFDPAHESSVRPPKAYWKALAFFALDVVQPVRPELPEVVEASLLTAERFWQGTATGAELLTARTSAWRAIEGRSSDFRVREVNLVRLAICALYEEMGPHHFFPTIEAMYDFASDVGVEEDVFNRCLRSRFAPLLGDAGAAS